MSEEAAKVLGGFDATAVPALVESLWYAPAETAPRSIGGLPLERFTLEEAPDSAAGLRRAIAWAAESPDIGAVLLTGAGSAFCSGGDVKAMGSRNRSPDEPGREAQFQALRARCS